MIRRSSVLAIAVMLCWLSVSALRAETTNEFRVIPKSKLEVFGGRTGVIMIKGTAEIGAMPAKAGNITVKCREYTDLTHSHTEYGVAVEIDLGSGKEDTTIIDDDELDVFIRAIDYVSVVNPTVTAVPSFEASYTTRSEMRVATYYSRRTGTMEAALHGNREIYLRAPMTLSHLSQFRTLIDQAKRKIEELKAGKR